jgi:hypothetical protein
VVVKEVHGVLPPFFQMRLVLGCVKNGVDVNGLLGGEMELSSLLERKEEAF